MGCLNSKESDLDQRMTSVAGGGAPAPRKTTGGGGLKKGKTDWGEMNAGVDNLKETVTAAVGDWTAPLPEGDDIPFASQGMTLVTNDNQEDLQVGKKIGEGNYGVVYKGLWKGKDVAIKQLIIPKKEISVTNAVVMDFKCEVEVCCRVQHESLVQFLGYTTEPVLCIIQEYIPRGSLYDLFQKGWRAKADQHATMALDTAQGVEYLHAWQPPLIHRDLKSLNVLVTEDYRLKITDFGMTRAKAVAVDSKANMQTQLMTQCGTPYWTAPEILMQKPYNEKVDTYAFAMLMYEIQTGETPFKENPMVVMRKVCHEKFRPAIPASTPPELQTIMQACWADEPKSRPPFTRVVADLSAYCTSAGIAYPPEAP